MKRNLITLLFLVIGILILLFCMKECNKKIEKEYDNHNIKINQVDSAKTDSVTFYKEKYYNLFTKYMNLTPEVKYITVNNESERIVYKQEIVSNIVTKTDTVVKYVKIDSLALNPIYSDFSKVYDSDNFRKLIMRTDFIKKDSVYLVKNFLEKDSLKIKIETGIYEQRVNGLAKIYVKSNYKDFVVSNLDGELFDPRKSKVISSYFKQSKINFGPIIGYGIMPSIKNNTVTINPGFLFGIGLQYKIF